MKARNVLKAAIIIGLVAFGIVIIASDMVAYAGVITCLEIQQVPESEITQIFNIYDNVLTIKSIVVSFLVVLVIFYLLKYD